MPANTVINEHHPFFGVGCTRQIDSESTDHPAVATENAARPQMLRRGDNVDEMWPEWWGLRVSQVRALVEECKADPEWSSANSMRVLVDRYVKPKTAGTGLGYALLINGQDPLECQVMISHSWNENAEDFVEALERTAFTDEVMFICALSMFQNCDGSGPSIAEQIGGDAADSPFFRVLSNIKWKTTQNGVISRYLPVLEEWPRWLYLVTLGVFFGPILHRKCIPGPPGSNMCFFTNKEDSYASWSSVQMDTDVRVFAYVVVAMLPLIALFQVFLWHVRKKASPGRMIAVPNREDELYSRLWCVYEMFVAMCLQVPVVKAFTLAPVGSAGCRHAHCSSAQDELRIRNNIEEWGESHRGSREQGFDAVDAKISLAKGQARVTTFSIVLRATFPLTMAAMFQTNVQGIYSLEEDRYVRSERHIVPAMIGTPLGVILVSSLLFTVVSYQGGKPTALSLTIVSIVLFAPRVFQFVLGSAPGSFVLILIVRISEFMFLSFLLLVAHLLLELIGWKRRLRGKGWWWVRCSVLSVWCAVITVTGYTSSFGKYIWQELPSEPSSVYPWLLTALVELCRNFGALYFAWWATSHWGVQIAFEPIRCRRWAGMKIVPVSGTAS